MFRIKSCKKLINYETIVRVIRLIIIIYIYERKKIIFLIYFAYYCNESSILWKLHEKHQTMFSSYMKYFIIQRLWCNLFLTSFTNKSHSNFPIKFIINLMTEVTKKYEITIIYRAAKRAGLFMGLAYTASISLNVFTSIFLDQRWSL